MKKLVKNLLVVSGVCMLTGALLGGVGHMLGGEMGFLINREGLYTNRQWREKLGESKEAVLVKTEMKGVTGIAVQVKKEDIEILESEDDKFYLEYRIPYWNKEPDYLVRDGVLTVEHQEQSPMENGFYGFNFFLVTPDSTRPPTGIVTVYVPKKAELNEVTLNTFDGTIHSTPLEAEEIAINVTYGELELSGLKAGTVTIESDDARIGLKEISADKLNVTNHYGDINLSKVSADQLDIAVSDGKIRLRDVSAGKLGIRNTYGKVEGTDIRAQQLSVEMSDGTCNLDLWEINQARLCNAYGDVSLTLPDEEDDYAYDLKTEYGGITVNERRLPKGEHYIADHGSGKKISVTATDGEIVIMTK